MTAPNMDTQPHRLHADLLLTEEKIKADLDYFIEQGFLDLTAKEGSEYLLNLIDARAEIQSLRGSLAEYGYPPFTGEKEAAAETARLRGEVASLREGAARLREALTEIKHDAGSQMGRYFKRESLLDTVIFICAEATYNLADKALTAAPSTTVPEAVAPKS